MTRLLLVRHGQSTWNARRRWQGQADPPLSDLGRQQAIDAAAAVGAVGAVWASTLERARHTAELISEVVGVGPVRTDPRLVERAAGEWQGLTREEIEAAWPDHLDDGRRPPGWEPDESVLGRVLPALEAIAGEHPGDDMLVVTHGGVIYQVEEHLGGAFEKIPNLGARRLARDGGRWHLGERLHLLPPAEETTPDQL